MCVFIGWKQRLTCCIGVDGRRTWLSSRVLTLDQFLSSLLDIGHFLGFPKVRSWAHNFFFFFFCNTGHLLYTDKNSLKLPVLHALD